MISLRSDSVFFKLLTKFIKLIHGTWAIPFVLIMRFIKPLVLIRIGSIRSDRIGNFVGDAGQQWAMLHNKEDGVIDWYWLQENTCNDQWEKMVRRNFPIYFLVEYLCLWNKYIPGGDAHYRPSTSTRSRDTAGLLEKNSSGMLKFLPEENVTAKQWLRRQGWADGDPFVCLLVRDSSYLDSRSDLSAYNWDYHSYRNSDLDSYLLAMEWLAGQGIWVLRMGKNMHKPIKSSNRKIIDYAFSSDRSDLLDIWLFGNCDLCISTLSGADYISDVYRRPLLNLNFLPLVDMISWSNSISYPKKLVWNSSKSNLTLSEYLDNTIYHTEDYVKTGINIIDLSSSDILAVVKEAWNEIKYKDENINNYSDQKNKFWKIVMASNIYMKNHNFIHPNHNFIHPMSRISSVFLEKNKNFLT